MSPRWRLPQSLRLRLLIVLIAAIAVTAGVQGLFAYKTALGEADALFDYHMQQTAFALRAGLPADAKGMGRPRPEYANNEFIVQVWTNEGLRIFESALGDLLPQRAVLGFQDVRAHGRSYRVFSLQTRSQVIQVAQDLAVRRKMARGLAWRSLLPLAVMAPLLALAVWWLLGRLFVPVERVRSQVARRQPQDLSALHAADLPAEVQPLVDELNALFERVRRAFAAQQDFVADAAHELRSPLAALKLQAQGLRRAGDAPTRERAVARLEAGIDRAARLLEQLLVLARQEAAAGAMAPVDLLQVARLALADVAASAQARGIDAGLAQPAPAACPVQGVAEELRLLLRNLLDNAIKYTPEGGRVDVVLACDGAAVQLRVEDSGPGIPEAERERVLGRFYRSPHSAPQAPGSGLGLAIVQAVAQRHGARLRLGRSERLGGLCVCLAFA
ncbi:ATP-binding protein [Comamonas flocculans]|uniref:histidine kinase n=1 Tax=Comamonas flocculans TaxID=2597701 RepID=A0A5B8RXP3_9BURK|nr:ATP-binding protein [Comamonas flocculans]QEA13408.1 two-component sensor histidine kinase [Comamonas flocculans]